MSWAVVTLASCCYANDLTWVGPRTDHLRRAPAHPALWRRGQGGPHHGNSRGSVAALPPIESIVFSSMPLGCCLSLPFNSRTHFSHTPPLPLSLYLSISLSLSLSLNLSHHPVSRCFGDGRFKHVGAIAQPDVCALPLRPGPDPAFVLMACDGVWKTFGVDGAATFVLSELEQASKVSFQIVGLLYVS